MDNLIVACGDLRIKDEEQELLDHVHPKTIMDNLIVACGDLSVKDEEQELLDVHPKKERVLSVKPKNCKKDRKKSQKSLNKPEASSTVDNLLDDDEEEGDSDSKEETLLEPFHEESESDEEPLILPDPDYKLLLKYQNIPLPPKNRKKTKKSLNNLPDIDDPFYDEIPEEPSSDDSESESDAEPEDELSIIKFLDELIQELRDNKRRRSNDSLDVPREKKVKEALDK